MSLPIPRAGLVVRHSVLWSNEARKGATEGRKDRPVAIVVATKKDQDSEVKVIVAPITHAPPEDPATSIEVPSDVSRALGLDGDRHWIRIDELNRFSCPGYDLRSIPNQSGEYDHGMLPVGLYTKMKAGIIERQRLLAVKIMPGD